MHRTWHVDVDAAIIGLLGVVSAVEAVVETGVIGSGLVHRDSGDKQATVVLLRFLRHLERSLPGQFCLTATGQGKRGVERHDHLLRLWQQHGG